MNLHEYQAKELLKKFDLPVPKGLVFIENLSQIEENLETLKALRGLLNLKFMLEEGELENLKIILIIWEEYK